MAQENIPDWPKVREGIIRRARELRRELVSGIDDFDAMRQEIQFNYVIDAAQEYFRAFYTLHPKATQEGVSRD